jgi:hypothetical protein
MRLLFAVPLAAAAVDHVLRRYRFAQMLGQHRGGLEVHHVCERRVVAGDGAGDEREAVVQEGAAVAL